jgi:hypothetical protein
MDDQSIARYDLDDPNYRDIVKRGLQTAQEVGEMTKAKSESEKIVTPIANILNDL